jgi:hypothetical protein
VGAPGSRIIRPPVTCITVFLRTVVIAHARTTRVVVVMDRVVV